MAEIQVTIRRLLLNILPLIAVLSCVTPFPYDDYDYHLDGLALGIAFPEVSTASGLSNSVKHLKTLSLGHVRIGEDWSLREASEGVFSWTPLGDRLRAFSSQGIQILLTIQSRAWPSWLPASTTHDDATTLAKFRIYVRALLEAYGDKIYAIQFGNEWNWEIDTYLGGSEAAYISFTNIMHEEVLAYRLSLIHI